MLIRSSIRTSVGPLVALGLLVAAVAHAQTELPAIPRERLSTGELSLLQSLTLSTSADEKMQLIEALVRRRATSLETRSALRRVSLQDSDAEVRGAARFALVKLQAIAPPSTETGVTANSTTLGAARLRRWEPKERIEEVETFEPRTLSNDQSSPGVHAAIASVDDIQTPIGSAPTTTARITTVASSAPPVDSSTLEAPDEPTATASVAETVVPSVANVEPSVADAEPSMAEVAPSANQPESETEASVSEQPALAATDPDAELTLDKLSSEMESEAVAPLRSDIAAQFPPVPRESNEQTGPEASEPEVARSSDPAGPSPVDPVDAPCEHPAAPQPANATIASVKAVEVKKEEGPAPSSTLDMKAAPPADELIDSMPALTATTPKSIPSASLPAAMPAVSPQQKEPIFAPTLSDSAPSAASPGQADVVAVPKSETPPLMSLDQIPRDEEGRKQMAKEMLEKGKSLAQSGQVAEAENILYQVRELAVRYRRFQYSPESLERDIMKARQHLRIQANNTAAAPTRG